MVDGPLGRLPETATCPRCGLTRKVKAERKVGVCRECMVNIPEPTEREALPPGRWVTRRNVRVFEPNPKHCHCGAPLVGPSCDTCLRWAERDAERHGWAVGRRSNRGRIWDVLNARKEAA